MLRASQSALLRSTCFTATVLLVLTGGARAQTNGVPPAQAAPPAGAQVAAVPRTQPAAVTLTQPAPGIYTIANGIVTMTLDGPRVAVTSIVYNGVEMVSQHGSHNRIYWSMDGPPNYQVAADAVCTVKANTPEMADVGCKHTYSTGTHADAHAVDIDIHYVVRRNKPGVYAYAILSHPASYPATSIGEWRMVWPTNSNDGERRARSHLRGRQAPLGDAFGG